MLRKKINPTIKRIIKFNINRSGITKQYEIEYTIKNKTTEFIFSENTNENSCRRLDAAK